MPIPALAAAALAGTIGKVQDFKGSLINFGLSELSNRRQRKWATEMYDRQYQDNINFWHQQNEYNSPANQMQRYTDAGLNPNLIYGATSPGNAELLKSPQPIDQNFALPEYRPSSVDILGNISQIYDLDMKKVQIDNAKQQGELMQADLQYKNVMTGKALADTYRQKFGLKFDQLKYGKEESAMPYYLEGKKLGVEKQKQDIEIAFQENARRADLTKMSLKKQLEEILNLKSERSYMPYRKRETEEKITLSKSQRELIAKQLDLMDKDGRLKDIDLALQNTYGISSKDEPYYKVIAKVAMWLWELAQRYRK